MTFNLFASGVEQRITPVFWRGGKANLGDAIRSVEGVLQSGFRCKSSATIAVLGGENLIVGGTHGTDIAGGIKKFSNVKNLLHELHRIFLVQRHAGRVWAESR